MNGKVDDKVWQTEAVVERYLERTRNARPFLKYQLNIMLELAKGLTNHVNIFMDLGCGDGLLAEVLLQAFPESQAILIDHSPPMLRAAEKKFKRQNNVHVICADYGEASWTDSVSGQGPYDLIVSGFSIHHQPDTRKRGVYQEIFSLLGSGGVFLNLEHVSSPTPLLEKLWSTIYIDSLHQHFNQIGLEKTREEIEEEHRNRPDREANQFSAFDLQCDWLKQIGFTNVDCYFKFFELAVFGGTRP